MISIIDDEDEIFALGTNMEHYLTEEMINPVDMLIPCNFLRIGKEPISLNSQQTEEDSE